MSHADRCRLPERVRCRASAAGPWCGGGAPLRKWLRCPFDCKSWGRGILAKSALGATPPPRPLRLSPAAVAAPRRGGWGWLPRLGRPGICPRLPGRHRCRASATGPGRGLPPGASGCGAPLIVKAGVGASSPKAPWGQPPPRPLRLSLAAVAALGVWAWAGSPRLPPRLLRAPARPPGANSSQRQGFCPLPLPVLRQEGAKMPGMLEYMPGIMVVAAGPRPRSRCEGMTQRERATPLYRQCSDMSKGHACACPPAAAAAPAAVKEDSPALSCRSAL